MMFRWPLMFNAQFVLSWWALKLDNLHTDCLWIFVLTLFLTPGLWVIRFGRKRCSFIYIYTVVSRFKCRLVWERWGKYQAKAWFSSWTVDLLPWLMWGFSYFILAAPVLMLFFFFLDFASALLDGSEEVSGGCRCACGACVNQSWRCGEYMHMCTCVRYVLAY